MSVETKEQLRARLFAGGSFSTVGLNRARAILSELRPPGGIVVATVSDHVLPGDPPVGVRVYHPRPGERLPVLVWVHGGGWSLGGLDTSDTVCRELAARAGRVVVSVEHRLAPEHPFPAPLDDVTAALRWVLEHAEELGGDARSVTMGGESAGANLAIGACLRMAESSGTAQRVAQQLLVVPVVDLAWDRPSMVADRDPGLPVRDLRWFADLYLPDEQVRKHPHACPLASRSLSELPPTTVVTAGRDPLCDGGRALATRLVRVGVPVNHLHYAEAGHGFFAAPGDAAGEAALADVVRVLGRES